VTAADVAAEPTAARAGKEYVMATDHERDRTVPRRWARLRFSILGPLLAAPPEHGELRARIEELAAKAYQHPTTGEVIRFGASTIEKWYYAAKDAADPVAVLARKVPSHAGTYPSMPARLAGALEAQYRAHPGWSFQLHHDNLRALVRETPALGPMPSYATTRRYMRHRGWLRHRKKRRLAADVLEAREARETRSFEVSHVHALWHLDFHEGSRKVLTAAGEWKTPKLLGVLDDRSRLCCHLQWYLDETAETLVHGLSQAIAKRGLPRGLLTDNGAAMIAAETTEGLERLGISHHTTLPYSPEQNAKQEVFWAQVEGRLMAMLEGEPELTLALLNQATQAWVEHEYQRRRHDELGTSPLDAALAGPSLVRPSPSSEELRRAFRLQTSRAVRRSDGTFTLAAVRFELPWQYRTLTRVTVRVARWDLSAVDLVDPRTGRHLAVVRPLDKTRNADGRRRAVPIASPTATTPPPSGIAPHLRQLMAEYAATGMPPAYLPKHDIGAALDELVELVEFDGDAPGDPPITDDEDPR
jgi:putative transposase